VGTESLNCDACSTCVLICASSCTKIFILSLIVSDLGFLYYPYFFLLLCNSS
jgi:hypothetical protein